MKVHIFQSADLRLVEVSIFEVCGGRASNVHATVSGKKIREEMGKRGYLPVTEADIKSYATATFRDENHWERDSGRRFYMDPIIKQDERGAVINYSGPWSDTGHEGYEIGLWRSHPTDPLQKEIFPSLHFHPVQIMYPILRSLVAKVVK